MLLWQFLPIALVAGSFGVVIVLRLLDSNLFCRETLAIGGRPLLFDKYQRTIVWTVRILTICGFASFFYNYAMVVSVFTDSGPWPVAIVAALIACFAGFLVLSVICALAIGVVLVTLTVTCFIVLSIFMFVSDSRIVKSFVWYKWERDRDNS
ncbi:MAG: hypothetical protein A3D65_03075 [Candidatus Lloydbacteria bacterium RIFCSPHIGHO2_02_FULL_50_13]|uniref:Uncharacterized protein n=1 Tax=Candidatus Lloydbacteria bacterium RIFCSPHIGHO2_02_FULL_50_13 TaxID=1798661 RepID=A0A1G2DA74_9BACT|nr:MAG: hypothetical protein A3D65_03075 [Candidatus Lloydbacteria bacterium RIFCSPHIGHO2_02_FULL_50_13]